MEEIRRLVGKEVYYTAYIGKEREKLKTNNGIVKSVSPTKVVFESLRDYNAIPIETDKIMIIKERGRNWLRSYSNAKVLWGNPKVFKRYEDETKTKSNIYPWLYGLLSGLGILLMFISAFYLLGQTGYPTLIHQLKGIGFNITDSEYKALPDNVSFYNLITNKSVNASGVGVPTNILSANQWQAFTIINSNHFNEILGLTLFISGYFLFWIFLIDIFPSKYWMTQDLRAYLKQKFDDEVTEKK